MTGHTSVTEIIEAFNKGLIPFIVGLGVDEEEWQEIGLALAQVLFDELESRGVQIDGLERQLAH